MHISKYRLRNFRNFESAQFTFKDGVNTLIGENGSGKSNALQGLRLMLDEGLARRACILRESDFCRAIGDWRGHWVVLSLDFDDLSADEGCQMIAHHCGKADGSSASSEGTLTYYFRPKKEVRANLYELTKSDAPLGDRRERLKAITVDDYEYVFTGRGEADFTDAETYSRLVGDFTKLSFPDPEDDDCEALGAPFKGLHREISCTHIKALRDVVADLRGQRSSPLLSLLRGAEAKVPAAEAAAIVKLVDDLNKNISDLDEIKKIAGGIRSTLQTTVGHTYAPNVEVESSMPNELDRLFQRLALQVGDPLDVDYLGELLELGLGGANLVFIALKLLEFDLKLQEQRAAQFLLIEEPEAHIHTHLQMTLFERHQAAKSKTQVIVTTHSTHLSAASKVGRVNILARQANSATVFQPANGLPPEECQKVERYLDAVRSTLLFAKSVILVEGTAEQVLIPAMVRKVLGVTLDELGVSLISVDTAFFTSLARLFHDDRIRRRCAIVTDLDEAFIPLADDEKKDTLEQKHARSSAAAGALRKKGLDPLFKSNPWLDVAYAKHTFEVEFIQAGNADVVVFALDGIFQQKTSIKRSAKKLRDAKIEVFGTEVLRLAGKVGKGWLALLFAERLTSDTIIPGYILKALAFAARDVVASDQVARSMALYRVRQGGSRYSSLKGRLTELENLPTNELLDEIKAAVSSDPVVQIRAMVVK